MPGGLHDAKNEKTTKKLKQAQLPFKLISPVAATPTVGGGKANAVKKRPFTKDEPGGNKAAQPKKAKTSSSESECVEVSSSSDEPRAVSPRRRSRAPLDQFVRVESPVSEVSTSCDLVDLTSEDKENRAEPPARDVQNTKAGDDTETMKVKKSDNIEALNGKDTEDAKVEKSSVEKRKSASEVSEKTESSKSVTTESAEIKESHDAGVSGKRQSKGSVVSISKTKRSFEKRGTVTKVSEIVETKTNEIIETKAVDKSDALEGPPAIPDASEEKTDEKSDELQSEACQSVEKRSATPEKDADVPMSEPEAKSPAKEPADSADTAASPTTTLAEDKETTKPSQESANPTTADALDSEKDEDADDESADDVVVLDENKLKPTEDGTASGVDGKAAGCTTPSTKLSGITKKRTPKQRERERIRAKREQEKLEEKRRREEEKEKARKEKQEQKEKERKEKEEKREKERKEKEEKKEKERLEKEKEKLEKQKQKEAEKQKLMDEKKQAKEEEKNRKEEEKRKAEEEEQRKMQKAKSMFSSFFVKKPKEAEVEQEEQKEEDNKLFQEFRVKEDMVLAPGARTALSACQSSQLERALAAADRPVRQHLYLAELRGGHRQPQTRSRTLPPIQKDLEIIEDDDEDDDKELDGLAQNIVLSSAAAATSKLRYKLLMFHENRRPAYWGTWSKRCRDVTGRRPLGRAQVLNYDDDSDDDWEEEDPNGESLSGSEKEVESEDDYEVDNEYFVPHGYLSDEEIKDEEEMMSPEAQKARLKEKGEEFEKQMKKKTTALKPRLIGCVWRDDDSTDPMFHQLLKLLRPFSARPLSILPVPTAASGEVDSTPLAGPSPAETPVSSAQNGLKFFKTFPDEALLPLARLVHGSTRGKPLLVREFATFWKRRVHGGSPRKADPAAAAAAAAAGPQTPPSAADGVPPAATGGQLLSKRKIEDKLCEIATYGRCSVEGALFGRCCWMVRKEVLAALGAELPLPSQWKWITKTAASRSREVTPGGASPAAAAAPAAVAGMGVTPGTPGTEVVPPERPRPATSLITKFTRVVTAEEARSDLLTPPPAKRKVVPTKLISPQAPATGQPAQPGIATFFKSGPSAAAGGPSTSAGPAGGGTAKRRLVPTPVGPRPGPSSAAPAGRRLAPTLVSAGQPGPARRLTPTAVPCGQPAAGRRLAITPVTAAPAAGGTASSSTAVTDWASAPGTAKSLVLAPGLTLTPVPTTAPAPSKPPELAPRKITLISLPRGLPELAKAATAPAPAPAPASAAAAEPMEVAPAAADVETITLD